MIKEARWEQILGIIEQKGFVSVQKLAETLYVSLPTVRRDLSELERQGLVVRSHGGVKLPTEGHTQVPIGFRNTFKMQEKRRLCEIAAGLIKDGDVIYLDPSTTFLRLADYISEKKNIIVVTNSLSTASTLVSAGIRTFCTGGELSEVAYSFTGGQAESMAADFNYDIAFFSSYGVNERGIITDTSEREISLRRVVMKQSKKCVYVCNGEKFTLSTPFNFTPLSRMDMVITDAEVPEYCNVDNGRVLRATQNQ
ncbi:MAG: DeoR/GlpR transcriptional regulator [Clostridia bacterium]|nr:DeoR/GlpR transcriptional regulator [Clostridia bacterium]